VGKTNIITRFTKDEFTDLHNFTLEGQQSACLDIDGRVFEINLYDTAGNHPPTTQDKKT
jgi:GTPase SAR1 family protein